MVFERKDLFFRYHIVGSYVLLHFIKRNPITKKYEADFSSSTKVIASFVCLWGFLFFTVVLLTTYFNTPWTKYDILTLLSLPIFLVIIPLLALYPYRYQKEFINVLDNIGAIDELLHDCGAPDLNNCKVNKILKCLIYIYGLIFLLGTFWWYTFFANKSMRQFLLMACLSPGAIYHTFCSIFYKAQLINRMHRLKQLSNNTLRKNVYSDKCFICTEDAIRGDICYEHMLQLSHII